MLRLTLLVVAAVALVAIILLLRRRSARPPAGRLPEAGQTEPEALPPSPVELETPPGAGETAGAAEAIDADETGALAPTVVETAASGVPSPQPEPVRPAPEPVPPTAAREPAPSPEAVEPADPAGTAAPLTLTPEDCAARLNDLERQLRAWLAAAIGQGDDDRRDRLQRALVRCNDRLTQLADSCAEESACRGQVLAHLATLDGGAGNGEVAAAVASLRAGDPRPAEELLVRLGEGADGAAARAAYLGGWLADCRVDLERALALYRRAVTLAPDNADHLLAAGRAARNLYHYREAMDWLQARVRLCAEQAADDPVTLALAQRELAYTCVLGGQQRQAGPLYKEAMTALAGHLGQDHAEMAVCWQQVGELQELQGEDDKAAALYRKALQILERRRGAEHPSLLPVLDKLAALCVELELEKEAVPLYERLVRIRERVLRPDHPQLALCLNSLAEACRLLGRYPEAEASYRKSLAITEAVHGPDHPAVAAVLQELAKLCASQGRKEEADRLGERAGAIFRHSVEAAERQHGQESLTLDL